MQIRLSKKLELVGPTQIQLDHVVAHALYTQVEERMMSEVR